MPTAAQDAWGATAQRLSAYGDLLVGPAVERGLLGPAEPARIWTRHLLNCAAVAELVPHGSSLVDLGSGAGLPGMVLALLRPDLSVDLVEPMQRRCAFLREVISRLGVAERVRVRRGRAEDCHRAAAGQPALSADVLTARALAPLSRLVEFGAPLLNPAGRLLAIKGQRASEEVAAARPILRQHRMRARVERPDTVGGGSATVVVVERSEGGAR
jgi:16S rRNA (guanine527-N7)-methyltransferase